MKKDRLFGLSGLQATILGALIYVVTHVTVNSIALGTVLDVVAIWFFVLGIMRLLRDRKNKKPEDKE